MKRKKFTEDQIVKALNRAEQGEGPKVICRELGIHEQTFSTGKRSMRAWKSAMSSN